MITVTENLTAKKLRKIEPGEPIVVGGAWSPMDYPKFVEQFQDSAKEQKLTIQETRATTGGTDAGELVVSLIFSDPSGYNGLRPTIGVITGNAGRRRRLFYAGVFHEKYQTGLVLASSFGHKNTLRNDQEADCKEAMHWFKNDLLKGKGEGPLMKDLVKDLMNAVVTKETADHLLCEACRGGIKDRFKWSKLGLVDKALKDGGPEVSQFRLYLAYSMVVKTCQSHKQMDHLLKFYRIMIQVPAGVTG